MERRRNLFIKWFITFAAISTAVIIAGTQGLFSLVLQSDISHLSSIIAVLFIICSVLAGKLSYDLSKERPRELLNEYRNDSKPTAKLKRRLKFLNFMADTFFTLGLAGTVIGFCYMMRGTLNANNDVSTIITQLKIGSSTKLYTTLSGIISSLLLQLQVLIIESDLINDGD